MLDVLERYYNVETAYIRLTCRRKGGPLEARAPPFVEGMTLDESPLSVKCAGKICSGSLGSIAGMTTLSMLANSVLYANFACIGLMQALLMHRSHLARLKV